MAKLVEVEADGSWRELPVGEQVHASYLSLARTVLAFEKAWLSQWLDTCPLLAAQHLKQPILVQAPNTGEW